MILAFQIAAGILIAMVALSILRVAIYVAVFVFAYVRESMKLPRKEDKLTSQYPRYFLSSSFSWEAAQHPARREKQSHD